MEASNNPRHYNYPFTSENEGVSLLNSIISSFERLPQSKLKKFCSQPELLLVDQIPSFIRSRNSIDFFTVLLKDAFGTKWHDLVQELREKTPTKSYQQVVKRKKLRIIGRRKTFGIILNEKLYTITLFQNQFIRVMKIHHPDHDMIDFLHNLLENCEYRICKVEFSMDFTGLSVSERIELMEFNKTKLYLKRVGNAFKTNYRETRYINNVWKHRSIGAKEYIKDDSFLRFEITLKTPFLDGQSVSHVKDLYRLTPSVVTGRTAYKVIDFSKWRNGFHKFPEHNNCFDEQDVVNEIEQIRSTDSLNGAVKYARKFVKPNKEFLRIHPFELVFKAAINTPFIQNEHPECIRVVQPTLAKCNISGTMHHIEKTDLIDEMQDREADSSEFLNQFECSAGDNSVIEVPVLEIIRDCDLYRTGMLAGMSIAEAIQPDSAFTLVGFWKTDYG